MLEIQHISAYYGNKKVLDDLSFSLPYGQNLSILGPNGCGKTTLIRCIASLLDFEGQILIDHIPLKQFSRKALASKISVMGQLHTVYFSYTVFETILLGRYQHIQKGLFSSPRASDYEYVEHCLEVTGLKDLKNRQIDTLSGGQLQRVFLAQTLAQEPNIILLDEPTNHLDLKHQFELIDYLKLWGEQTNHSVIGVFHDINLALNLSSQVLFLKEGHALGQGTFEELVTPDFLKEVYDMDVAQYMFDTYSKWKCLLHNKK